MHLLHNLFGALIWVLSVLASIAGFVDFLLNDGARKEVQQRLSSWHQMLDGDWRGLRSWIAQKLREFLTAVFGARIFGRRAIVAVVAIAFVYSLFFAIPVALRTYDDYQYSQKLGPLEHKYCVHHPRTSACNNIRRLREDVATELFHWKWDVAIAAIFYVGLLFSEFLAITAIRLVVNWSARRSGRLLLPALIALPHVGAAIVVMTIGCGVALSINHTPSTLYQHTVAFIQWADSGVGLGKEPGADPPSYEYYGATESGITAFALALAIPEAVIIDALHRGVYQGNLTYILPLVSSISTLAIVVSVYIVSLWPRWARKSLSLIVGRMAEAPKGAFSAAAVGLTCVIGLLKALVGQG